MSAVCSRCKTIIGGFNNYGTAENPLCFECAKESKCAHCGAQLDVQDQIRYKGKTLCKQCHAAVQASEQQLPHANVPQKPESTNPGEDRSFFSSEKKGIQKGVLGGVVMIAIAAIWFFVGYAAGHIYFYPPILFIIGVYAVIKGLTTGNYTGNTNDQAPQQS